MSQVDRRGRDNTKYRGSPSRAETCVRHQCREQRACVQEERAVEMFRLSVGDQLHVLSHVAHLRSS